MDWIISQFRRLEQFANQIFRRQSDLEERVRALEEQLRRLRGF